MNVANGRVAVGDVVTYPTKTPTEGLGIQVGIVEAIYEDTGKVRIKPAWSSTRASRNADNTYKARAVAADIVVIIDRPADEAYPYIRKGDMIHIVPEIGPERNMYVCHVEHHIITMADV